MRDRIWKTVRGGRPKVATATLFLVSALAGYGVQPVHSEPRVVVYKSPTCGCCNKWVDHLRANGFEVETHDRRNMKIVKESAGVPDSLSSCHTAKVGGYIVEGHVPADVVKRLLREKPDAMGVSVPGMPMGSPGMEGPVTQKYNVMLFKRDGSATVYEKR